MLPDPPRPPDGTPFGPGSPLRKPLVGGLPWPDVPERTAAETSASPPVPPFVEPTAFRQEHDASRFPRGRVPAAVTEFDSLPRLEPRRRRDRDWLVDLLGQEEAADFQAIPRRIHGRIEAWLHDSPPFTVSLIVHVVALIVLALIFVRINRDRRKPIEITFASTSIIEAEKPGVQIVTPEPEPEPEPEQDVKLDEPPVEDPIAAPAVVKAEEVETLGAEPAPAAAPAVGSLLDGRQAGRRERLVGAYGGSGDTEAAVRKALEWLVRQQGRDGLWSLQGPYVDGASQENRLAATAMALLAFQGAGNTPREGPHKRAVAAAWSALLKKQVAGGEGESVEELRRSNAGRFEIGLQDPPARQALYSHAQVTIALCELYGMTKDAAYAQPARRAVAYALAAQGPNGGWRYEPGQNGDMSVTGWYMMALKSAEMAGVEVPTDTFAGMSRFLDGAAVDGGSRYGYRFDEVSRPADTEDRELVRTAAGPVTPAVSAEGLLCRQYLGWPRAHPALNAGVDVLLAEKFIDWDVDKDVYAWYYITQVVHHLGGPAWKRWNDRMKEILPAEQVAKGGEQGSWDPALDKWGPWGGRLFTTCFCTYMLEVYYRHLPLYGEEAVAAPP